MISPTSSTRLWTHHFCLYLSPCKEKATLNEQVNDHDCYWTQFLRNYFTLMCWYYFRLTMTSSGNFLIVWFSICFWMNLNLRHCVCDRKLTAFCSSDFLCAVYLSSHDSLIYRTPSLLVFRNKALSLMVRLNIFFCLQSFFCLLICHLTSVLVRGNIRLSYKAH